MSLDINAGCPTDLVCQQGEGAALLRSPNKLREVVVSMAAVSEIPITVKVRMGYEMEKPIIHERILPHIYSWGASALTIHGRYRSQRYRLVADWSYIASCSQDKPEPYFIDQSSFRFHSLHVFAWIVVISNIFESWWMNNLIPT